MKRLLLVLAIGAVFASGCNYVDNVKCPSGYTAYVQNARNGGGDIVVCFRTEDGKPAVNG